MKTRSVLSTAIPILMASLVAHAQLSIPSDGSDGALNVSTDTVIDLRAAVTGRWDASNAAHAGQGIYDPEKWAVVFKYSSVNIQGKVSFANHPTYAPVVWLVQGDVTIAGEVNLSGQTNVSGVDALVPREPGPGGFRGAATGPQGGGGPLGPGFTGPGRGFGLHVSAYGNPQIIPLIGGAGGAGGNVSGTGGGGAILIACSGRFTLDGRIVADGGNNNFRGDDAVGAGGAVRVVATEMTGTGEIRAMGGTSGLPSDHGRIRLETPAPEHDFKLSPETLAVRPADPPILWPSVSAPTVRVLMVDGVDSPADPTAPLARTADIALQNEAPVEVRIETKNFPIEGVVEVRGTGKSGGGLGGGWTWRRATHVSGDFERALWQVTQPLPKGFTVLQARAILP